MPLGIILLIIGAAAHWCATDPLDLEIIDRVYGAAWAQLLARNPIQDEIEEAARQTNLRQRLFALSDPGRVDFDVLYGEVLSSYDKPKTITLTT